MFISRKIIILLIVLLSLTTIVFLGYERRRASYEKLMPVDFNFSATIDFDTYTIDTYNNSLLKQFDWERDTLITFHVKKEFKEKIYGILRDIDIYKYPRNFAPTSTIGRLPSSSYHFKFTIDSITYSIDWVENTYSEIKDAKKLRTLFMEIRDYIEQDERVKDLPEDERAFL